MCIFLSNVFVVAKILSESFLVRFSLTREKNLQIILLLSLLFFQSIRQST